MFHFLQYSGHFKNCGFTGIRLQIIKNTYPSWYDTKEAGSKNRSDSEMNARNGQTVFQKPDANKMEHNHHFVLVFLNLSVINS